MARPKKNATVNEEVVSVPAEEKKAKRPGRPRKNAAPAEKAEVKAETAEVAAEAPVEAAPEVKEEVKQPAKRGRKKKTEIEAAAVEQKTTKKKTTETKKTEEKQPAKRGRKKAEEVKKKITTIVQYRGNQIEEKDMIEKVEAAWKAEGNKTPIETITMYVKPEDGKIYYVVNGLSGSVDLF